MKRPSLAELSAGTYDLVVVGGGIVGCGVARDAAVRGLRVALVEQHDFGSGTTSRSTADPRWPALPRAVRLRAGARRPARAGDAHAHRTPPGTPTAVPGP